MLNHRLVETGFGDKKGFTDYLKSYMKKILKHLEENDRKDEIEEFKGNINKVMKEMMGKFKDLQFFTGESIEFFRGCRSVIPPLVDFLTLEGIKSARKIRQTRQETKYNYLYVCLSSSCLTKHLLKFRFYLEESQMSLFFQVRAWTPTQ